MTTGEKIKQYRAELGLTQEELGARLGVTGSGISSWERDRTEPNMKQIKDLCRVFNKQPSDFVEGEDIDRSIDTILKDKDFVERMIGLYELPESDKAIIFENIDRTLERFKAYQDALKGLRGGNDGTT